MRAAIVGSSGAKIYGFRMTAAVTHLTTILITHEANRFTDLQACLKRLFYAALGLNKPCRELLSIQKCI